MVTILTVAMAASWFTMAVSFLAAIVLIPMSFWGIDYLMKNVPEDDPIYLISMSLGFGFAILWLVFGGLTIFLSRTIEPREGSDGDLGSSFRSLRAVLYKLMVPR